MICLECRREVEIQEPCLSFLQKFMPDVEFTHFEVKRLEKILAQLVKANPRVLETNSPIIRSIVRNNQLCEHGSHLVTCEECNE